jgi:hypothetical protein
MNATPLCERRKSFEAVRMAVDNFGDEKWRSLSARFRDRRGV